MRRRTLLGGLAGSMVFPRIALGESLRFIGSAPPRAPVCYVGHGGPSLATSEERGAALRAWGEQITAITGVVAITPHVRARTVELGAVGEGRILYSFPSAFITPEIRALQYRTPSNEALATRVTTLLEERLGASRLLEHGRLQRSARTGLDHTVWMPLVHLRPRADVPVVDLALPFCTDGELIELGAALEPLRREGVMILCSGNVTHNLAAMSQRTTPRWARDFDAWLERTIEARDRMALVDWRRAAPRAYLAHPDDGGHYDVLLVGIGACDESFEARFPVVGFEDGPLSKRCVQLR